MRRGGESGKECGNALVDKNQRDHVMAVLQNRPGLRDNMPFSQTTEITKKCAKKRYLKKVCQVSETTTLNPVSRECSGRYLLYLAFITTSLLIVLRVYVLFYLSPLPGAH